MNEEKNIASVKVKIKKVKTKNTKKTKAKKSPFGLNNDFNIVPISPEPGFKMKEKSSVSKLADSKKIYRKIAFSFVVLTLLLVAAVLYFSFSKLTIVIIPAKEKIADSSTMEVISNETDATRVNLDPGQIYGLIKQVPVEQSKEFNSSSKEILGEEVTGKVTIINNYIKNQPLVATTRLLSSDNKLFRLKNTVNVPAGGRVEAEVYADTIKPEMAIGPSKFTLPGLWAGIQDKIYAESQVSMEYSQKAKYVIGQNDIDNAISKLKNDLLTTTEDQLGQTYKNYPQVLFAIDNNSITQEVSGKVGEEKEKFSIKMKTMVTVVAFYDDEVYNQIKTKIASSLADDQKISEFSKQDISYSLGSFDIAKATAMVNIESIAQVALKDSAKVINKNNLVGLNYEQLKVYLNGLPEVAGYQIDFFPSFIKSAPKLVDRIQIEIKK